MNVFMNNVFLGHTLANLNNQMTSSFQSINSQGGVLYAGSPMKNYNEQDVLE